ncbi:MAG: glycogen debranching protein, partial [Chloroflexota bacterium]
MISVQLPELTFEREVLVDLPFQLDREWLVTNGIGGYASSSLCCANTRRYHGLLVAALHPPAGRTVMLARLDEELEVHGERIPLSTAEFHDGTIYPQGYRLLERFRLYGTIPVWTYRTPAGTLYKTLWMPYGQNCTYVRYELAGTAVPVTLHLTPLVTYRDYHHETRGDPAWRMTVLSHPAGCTVAAFAGAVPLSLDVAPGGTFVAAPDWYWRYLHRRERERGLDFLEDLYRPGIFSLLLAPGYP